MSEALQERIFRLFVVNSGEGERRDLIDVFAAFYQANLHPEHLPCDSILGTIPEDNLQ